MNLSEDDREGLQHEASCYVVIKTYLCHLKEWLYLLYVHFNRYDFYGIFAVDFKRRFFRQMNKLNREVHVNRLNSIIFLYQMINRYVFDYLDVTNDIETQFIESVWGS